MKNLQLQQAEFTPANIIFNKQDGDIKQILFFKHNTQLAHDIQLPIGKALRGSVIYIKDPTNQDANSICQIISFYRSNPKKYSTSIRQTNHSNVKITQNKLHINLSIQLADEPEKLKRQLQNFANIIIEETDEIAAMLNQEGSEKVQEAWQTLAQINSSTLTN